MATSKEASPANNDAVTAAPSVPPLPRQRLSDPETEALISLVQGIPCLWNEAHADFKNAGLRRRLWNQVGTRLHITGDEAKCKWKNLKDKFRKLRNIQELKSSFGIPPATPKWKFYNSMLFTRDVLTTDPVNGSFSNQDRRPLMNNCVSGESGDSSSLPSHHDDDSIDCDYMTDFKRESYSPPLLQMKRSRSPMNWRIGNDKKMKSSYSSDDAGKALQMMEKMCSSTVTTTPEDKKTDDYHFLMSLLPYMEPLDPLKKLELRAAIQKLVADSYKKHVLKKGFNQT